MNNRFEKYLFVVIIIFYSSSFIIAQENEFYSRSKPRDFKKDAHLDSIDNLIHYRKNVVYVEGLGNAGYGAYSLNYERKIGKNKNGFITTRIGFAYVAYKQLVFPLLINEVFNQQKENHFEFGGGITVALYENHLGFNEYWNPGLTANFMYRYQKPDGRFIFRVGWTPVIYPNAGSLTLAIFLLDCGISFGYAF